MTRHWLDQDDPPGILFGLTHAERLGVATAVLKPPRTSERKLAEADSIIEQLTELLTELHELPLEEPGYFTARYQAALERADTWRNRP